MKHSRTGNLEGWTSPPTATPGQLTMNPRQINLRYRRQADIDPSRPKTLPAGTADTELDDLHTVSPGDSFAFENT